MRSALRRFAEAPRFPGDDLKTHRAYVINATLMTFLATAVLALGAGIAGGHVPPVTLAIQAGFLSLCLVFRRWMHEGRIELATTVALAVGWITVTALLVTLGTIRVPTIGFYLILVNLAGLIFGLGAMILAIVLCSATVGALILAINAGLMPTPDHAVHFTHWVGATGLFACVGGLTYAAIHFVEGSLARAEREIAERKAAEEALTCRKRELQEALDQVKTLRGLLPVCGWCRKVRADDGYWKQIEVYVSAHTEATFTHGICPDCRREHFDSGRDRPA